MLLCGRVFEIGTVITKVPDEPSVLNFEVLCRENAPEPTSEYHRPDPIG